jgi:endonuclease/exonuclease/phosphatase family metal-dependent hydrolase
VRIIFFNIWHGHELDGLSTFLLREKANTDIFCFLETDPDLLLKLTAILNAYNYVFREGVKNLDGIIEGSAIFVDKKIEIVKHEEIKLYEISEKETGGLLTAELTIAGKTLDIGCAHGKSRPGNKLDTPERLKQSETIVDYFKNVSGPKIIGGDFNLDINTESLKIIEQSGYKNLIKEFNIQNTRNKLCWDQFPDEVKQYGKQYFADYCFVSPEVKVINFAVPNVEVSDHEPLILDFEV